jgi:hypothetical protein
MKYVVGSKHIDVGWTFRQLVFHYLLPTTYFLLNQIKHDEL